MDKLKLLKYRLEFFSIKRNDKEDFDDCFERFSKAAKKACLKDISEETLQGFILLNGLNNTEWERHILHRAENKGGEITIEDIMKTVHFEQYLDTIGDSGHSDPHHVHKVRSRH